MRVAQAVLHNKHIPWLQDRCMDKMGNGQGEMHPPASSWQTIEEAREEEGRRASFLPEFVLLVNTSTETH